MNFTNRQWKIIFQKNCKGIIKCYTVKEIYNTAEQILHQKIPYEIVARRAGDPASVLANASKAKEFLNWQAFYSLKDIILSDYNWRMKAGNSLVD